jgi:hypothetical protein
MSPKGTHITRQYGKLADAISFVGGLYGPLILVALFIFGPLNSYRGDISIGQVLFKYDKEGTQVKPKVMNIKNYFILNAYQFLRSVGYTLTSWA